MRPITIDVDLADADLDGIADGNSSAGTSVTLDGNLTSGGTFTSADGLGRIIVITDTGNDDQQSATYTITGTNSSGQAISESLAGPDAMMTAVSTKFFKTISSISIASPVASSTIDIGTTNTTLSARSRAIPLNYYAETGIQVALDITGTINCDVLITYDDLQGSLTAASDVNWIADANLAGETSDSNAQLPVGVTGMIIEVNSYSSGAEVQARIITPY